MTQPRSTEGRRPLTLTPTHRLPTGHEVRRSETVMRDSRSRKQARSSRRIRDRQEE